MSSRLNSCIRRAATVFLLTACVVPLGGCAVIAVADTAVGLAASGVGLAADAAIGTVRLTGRAVGAVADLAIPDSDSD